MSIIRFVIALSLGIVLVPTVHGQYTIRQPNAISLQGNWQFAMDPAGAGIPNRWFAPDFTLGRWDNVTVPHCFSVDPRFQFYTGAVWYRRMFPWQPSANKRVILHFDGVYYQCTVWLNGKQVGSHEGGYTPFQFDITDALKAGENTIALTVDNNTWKPGTIPGAKDNGVPGDPFMGWLNYGGVVRPVYLTVEPPVHLDNLKIDALPDLVNGTATLRLKTRIRNTTNRPVSPVLSLLVEQNGKPMATKWTIKSGTIAAGQTGLLDAETTLKANNVTLWSVDAPNLYRLRVSSGGDTLQTRFGIRKVEVRGTQLLLNGQPIRMAGGNRVVDYKELGSLEPDWVVDHDLRMMKEAGMELHRLTHYTPAETVYDWADQHGMLIIAEAGNWQLTPRQMDNDTTRIKFRQQFREMAERDWNHPSIIAWSVGNEYLSEQPAGQRWTKDMIAYARELDPTRLYTFASMRLNTLPQKPEDEASRYCDFVSTNTYGNHLPILKHIHALYPDKPIFISEYGIRADGKNGDAGQITYLDKFLSDIRSLPYVVGASWWSFNDYLSRHQGTNPSGFRPWGLVRNDRSKRPLYTVHQSSMAPLTVEYTGWKSGGEGVHKLTLRVTARPNFPAYTLRHYQLKINEQSINLPDLEPGQTVGMVIPIRGFSQTATIEILKPTGFCILTQQIDLTNDTRTSSR